MTHDGASKLSSRLSEQTRQADGAQPVEVVVELSAPTVPAGSSRPERMEAARTAFDRTARAVEHLVDKVGGHVTDTAWINATIRGHVPVSGLAALADDDAVAAIDLPGPLTTDHD
ncbi:hypothetical protein [Actinomycetospora sp.]|jgi:hypothetical protein|uniref:hypothetical protein n=1 Tax=Actinomycetospora sp. TaxID=1872135 RepID=UPI002F42F24D